jgi:hypothetical protein
LAVHLEPALFFQRPKQGGYVDGRGSGCRSGQASKHRDRRSGETADFPAAVPFICECGDPACQGLARLSLDAFDIVQSQPSWNVLGDAHEVRWRVVDTENWMTVNESGLRIAEAGRNPGR